MNRIAIVLTIALIVISATRTTADAPKDETKIVPIDRIWADNLPGARNITEIDEAPKTKSGLNLLQTIYRSAGRRADRLNFKDVARPSFAVSGNGRAALHAAYDILVDAKKPRVNFSPDEEITFVLFTEPVSKYRLRPQRIERKGNQIEIRYQLQASISGTSYFNFILIPLSKLPAGEYHVELQQEPRDLNAIEMKVGLKSTDKEWSNKALPKPLNFTVAKTTQTK